MQVTVTIEVVMSDGEILKHTVQADSEYDDLYVRGMVDYWLVIPAERAGRDMVPLVREKLERLKAMKALAEEQELVKCKHCGNQIVRSLTGNRWLHADALENCNAEPIPAPEEV